MRQAPARTPLTADDVRRIIQEFFDGAQPLLIRNAPERDSRQAMEGELDALAVRVLDRAVVETFTTLARNYDLLREDLRRLLDILVGARCRQVFKPALNMGGPEFELVRKAIRRVTKFLDDKTWVLADIFRRGFVEEVAGPYPEKPSAAEARDDQQWEQKFRGDGRARADIRVAVRVLRRTAELMKRFPLVSWEDAYGPIVRRGRPRKLAHEANAAWTLVDSFEAKTGLPLYEYVAKLLAAAFPAAKKGVLKKRGSDYIKQLLREYPRPPREQGAASAGGRGSFKLFRLRRPSPPGG